MGIFLPGLVKICQTLLEISLQKGYMGPISALYDLDLVIPKFDHFIPSLCRPLVPICINSVHSFSKQCSNVW